MEKLTQFVLAAMATFMAFISRTLWWMCGGSSGPDLEQKSPLSTLAETVVDDPAGRSKSEERPVTKFDVFLNHRGPDTKRTFVAHLNDALIQKGFHPFLDIKSLVKGEHAFDSIAAALQSVSIHVAVFSKGYAESKWCLNELYDMLETQCVGLSVIIPVFYGVEPEHLRRPEIGPFAAAFEKHTRKGRHDEVERWKKALFQAAAITGFDLKQVAGDENKLKENIVRQVIETDRNLAGHALQLVPPYRVGQLEESVKEAVGSLDKTGEGVQILGIVGMGGIGKTTLASEIFNHYKVQRTFERQTFLRDVRRSNILDLQNKQSLIRDLFDEEVKSVDNFWYWFQKIKGRKVLIVIDDIDHVDQFENLIPDINQLSGGTKIIVTSRCGDVLKRIMGEKNLYAVKELEHLEARKLFNFHAFPRESASIDLQLLAEDVADACKGLPLALQIMGSYLKNETDKKIWEETRNQMKDRVEILDQLGISYEGLSVDAKLMFLDISCLMIGLHEEIAMQIWESCRMSCNPRCLSSKRPKTSLATLKSRCLVTVDEDGELRVHDLLRDMGRNMAANSSTPNKPGKRSHLWDPTDAEWVLRVNKGSNKVRGFSMAGFISTTDAIIKCSAEGFARMPDLHLLLLDGCHLEGDFSKALKLLRWLKWRSSPILELPPSLSLPNLAVLDLSNSSNLTRLWPKDTHIQQFTKSLRRLILRNCRTLEELPENLETAAGLVVLDVGGCRKLQRLPETLGDLTELEILDLLYCDNLEVLPNSIGRLTQLKKIVMSGCEKLVALPVAFGNLQSLEEFRANRVPLSDLPDSFSQLSNLKVMSVEGCTLLTRLPRSMRGLVKLQILQMGATEVKNLPDDFGELGDLITFELSTCTNLKALPESFGNLSSLQNLSMHHNAYCTMLPENFGDLKSLVTLDLGSCSLQEGQLPASFGHLKMLRELKLESNLMITLPEGFRELEALVSLEMHHCPYLSDVRALPWSLLELDLGDCPKLTEIPPLSKLTLLTKLNLCNCTGLSFLQGVECLKALEEINVSGCSSLRRIDGLQHNRAMARCYLSGSKVSMKYDNNWSEEIPALQVVSYYDHSLGFASNEMMQRVNSKEYANDLCTQTIVSRDKCLAVVFCFVAHDQGWSDCGEYEGRYIDEEGVYSYCSIEARIIRDGQKVYVSSLFPLRFADHRDQVYICTLRRSHPFVTTLQQGDQICVYARAYFPGRITVMQGAVFLVHPITHSDQDLAIKNLDNLVLGDDVSRNPMVEIHQAVRAQGYFIIPLDKTNLWLPNVTMLSPYYRSGLSRVAFISRGKNMQCDGCASEPFPGLCGRCYVYPDSNLCNECYLALEDDKPQRPPPHTLTKHHAMFGNDSSFDVFSSGLWGYFKLVKDVRYQWSDTI